MTTLLPSLPRHLSRRMMLAGLGAALGSAAMAEPMTRSLRPLPRGAGPADVTLSTKLSAAAPPVAVTETPERLIEAARLGGVTGFAVIEVATGRQVEVGNANTALPPASVLKTVTALYALERLGAAHRFPTTILATGPVSGGIVQGDIVLSGGGDPSLDTDRLGDLAARLAAAGVRGATGAFVADAGALPNLDRLTDDQPEHVGYNPALSGLNLNFNRVHFEWKQAGKGWSIAMDARAERFVPAVEMSKVRIVARETPLFTYEGGESSDAWTVASAALGKGGSRWLPVRHPALYAAEVFRTLAAAQGIALPAPRIAPKAPDGATRALAVVTSDPLDVVLRDMLKYSTNLTAECVGLTSSGGRDLAGSGQAMADWARERLGMSSSFYGHSGLDRRNRCTAADMARAIAAADRAGAGLRAILRETPMRDAAGQPIKGHPTQIFAKTGTLNFCSSLAGLICPPNGRNLAFAILSADMPRREAVPEDQREQPAGLRPWLGRAREMQGKLLSRWDALYTAA